MLSPSSARTAARASLVTPDSPRMVAAGSPGSRLVSMKVRNDTASSVAANPTTLPRRAFMAGGALLLGPQVRPQQLRVEPGLSGGCQLGAADLVGVDYPALIRVHQEDDGHLLVELQGDRFRGLLGARQRRAGRQCADGVDHDGVVEPGPVGRIDRRREI